MLPGDGITQGIGKDKTCFTTEDQYKFKYGSEGLNTNEIKEYIRNPHKFNINTDMDGKYLNLWSTDNARTDGNDEVVIKSVYDPSPVGYSLPAPNAFTGFTTTGQRIGNWTNPVTPANPNDMNAKLPFDNGYYFYTKPNKQGNTIFFPTPGRRLHTTGTLFIDNVGTAQTAGNNNINIEAGLYFDKNIISPITDFSHSWGLPVRSAEEMETHKFNIKEEMDGVYYNLWSTDNDRTDNNDDVVIKTVYDPSPVGYSLPASNAFTGFTTTGGHTNNAAEYNVKGTWDKGWHFYTKPNKQGIPFFFPAWGYRYYTSGSLGNVSTFGFYWVAGPHNRYYGRYLSFSSGDFYPLNYSHRSFGFSVRSAEEMKRFYELCN